MEEEEEKRREEVEVVKEGEVDLWSESMQMEKEEDQRGQGRDLWECLGQKMEREVRLRSGLMEREREIEFVSVSRVAISMFAIRRTPTSVSCLIFWKKLLSV
jgi:hypothetical protein